MVSYFCARLYDTHANATSPTSDRNEKLLQDPVRLRQISERIPAGRWGEPRDFAGPAVFLASDQLSGYVTGAQLLVDGGAFVNLQ